MKDWCSSAARHTRYNAHDVWDVHSGVWGDFNGVTGNVAGL